MIKIVYIDLDGVLTNFEKLVFERFGQIDLITHNSWREAYHEDKTFFLDLEPFWYYKELISACQEVCDDVQILSATGYTNSERNEEQKREWCNRYIPELPVQIVERSADKAKHAWPGDGSIVLIDDRMKSIYPWRYAGGTGIHHITCSDTIHQLKKISSERIAVSAAD